MTKPTIDDTRFGESAGGVPDAGLSPPASGRKDTGYVNGDVPPPREHSWLWNKAHQWFKFLNGLIDGSENWTFPANVAITGSTTVAGTFVHETTWQHSVAFALPDGSASLSLGVAGTTATRLSLLTSSGDNILPLSTPIGTLTKWSVTANKTSATGTITARLYECVNASGVSPAQIGSTQSNSANNPGAISLGQIGLSFAMTIGREYFLVVNGGGVSGDQVTGYNVAVTNT